jgi:hypothetical protein
MVPKGLAAAVLAGLPLAAGMPGGAHIQNLAFAMVLASITLTALLVIGIERGVLQPFSAALFGKFPVAPPAPAQTGETADSASPSPPPA